MRLNASIPVIRGLNNIEQNLVKAIEALEVGDKVWIYPEGRVSKDGNIQKGKKALCFYIKNRSFDRAGGDNRKFRDFIV